MRKKTMRKLVRSLVETISLHCRRVFWQKEIQQFLECPASAPFDFCHCLHPQKITLPLAQIQPYAMTNFGFWWHSTIADGLGGVYRTHPIYLGFMILLNSKELLISEKDFLSLLTCGPSQKFSAVLEPPEFVFFFSVRN